MQQKIVRTMGALMLSLTLVSPLAAEDSSCYDYWLKKCNDALAESNWLEKVAVGAYCSAMLASCSVKTVTITTS